MIGLGSDKKAEMYNAGLNMDSRYDWLSCITFGGSLYQYWMVSIYRHKSLLVRHECVECTYQYYLTHFNGHHLRPLNVEPSILMVFDSGAIMAIVR